MIEPDKTGKETQTGGEGWPRWSFEVGNHSTTQVNPFIKFQIDSYYV